ncbi:nudC domain-containing protein 3 [Scomber japonicus]|uniref:nudC domain-containing protein 3 n=1 Tax=Scomber japonicus TaxID=13676 RepID=UPI002305666A|nr:nudC domain-containing protein 3 [Scomber japonicus]
MASPLQMTEMYDNALLGILQHAGNIQDFLHIYFGFLYRKTDFYRLLSSPNDKMGFPPGVAEKMVLKAFKLFEKVADHDRERHMSELQKRDESKSVVPPPAVQELEIQSESQEEETRGPRAEAGAEQTESSAVSAPPAATARPQSGSSSGASGVSVSSVSGVSTSGAAAGQSARGDQAAAAATKPTDEKEDKCQVESDSYNGAVREKYSWSQDYTDVEVRVSVPKTVVKGRQVSVSLQTGSVRVCVRDGAEEKTLLEGEFTHKINTENTLWSLEPGSCVVLSLNKASEVWWNAILKGEQEIDINQINRERSMATVDEEEHAVLDRLSFDYHQKLQGKPQSHEMMPKACPFYNSILFYGSRCNGS